MLKKKEEEEAEEEMHITNLTLGHLVFICPAIYLTLIILQTDDGGGSGFVYVCKWKA